MEGKSIDLKRIYRHYLSNVRKRLEKLKLTWKLVRDIKGNKKCFYRYLNCKRKIRENVDLLLNTAW